MYMCIGIYTDTHRDTQTMYKEKGEFPSAHIEGNHCWQSDVFSVRIQNFFKWD